MTKGSRGSAQACQALLRYSGQGDPKPEIYFQYALIDGGFCRTQNTSTHTYIHTYIHACVHTCIHTNKHTYIHTYIDRYTHRCMLSPFHPSIHTSYVHAFMHTCVHIYVIQAKHNANSELLQDKHRLHRGIFRSVTSNDRSHGRMLTHSWICVLT